MVRNTTFNRCKHICKLVCRNYKYTLGVVDVFIAWCAGPAKLWMLILRNWRLPLSSTMISKQAYTNMIITHLVRVTMARACSDNIEELAPFRSDPRPTWLFLSSGIPTALLRGANRWEDTKQRYLLTDFLPDPSWPNCSRVSCPWREKLGCWYSSTTSHPVWYSVWDSWLVWHRTGWYTL